MHKIGFPGIGIDGFEVKSTAFELFGRPVAWYGIIIALGMVVAITYIMWRTTQYKGITPDDIIDFALFVIIFGVIGARLYYVLFELDRYDSFADVIAIWNGGLAIYGGIIFGAITAIVICLIKKIHIPCFFDMLAPAVMIAQSIGRWGNFFNAEAYGSATDSIFRMSITEISSLGIEGSTIYVHPTFFYESMWNLVGFILLTVLYNKRKFDGQIVLGYIAWYGLGRTFIEGLRADSLYIGDTGIRVSQLIAIVSCVAAVAAMAYLWFYKKAGRYESASYKPVEQTESSEQVEEEIVSVRERIAQLRNSLFGKKNQEKTEQSEEQTENNSEDEENIEDGNDN